jgi:hypothetical protein
MCYSARLAVYERKTASNLDMWSTVLPRRNMHCTLPLGRAHCYLFFFLSWVSLFDTQIYGPKLLGGRQVLAL